MFVPLLDELLQLPLKLRILSCGLTAIRRIHLDPMLLSYLFQLLYRLLRYMWFEFNKCLGFGRVNRDCTQNRIIQYFIAPLSVYFFGWPNG